MATRINADMADRRGFLRVADAWRTPSGDSLKVASWRGRVSLESGNHEKPVCTLDVFIDGSDVSDIQMVPPNLIHGIEVRGVATTPVEYHASQCGAVLVWTK